MESRELVNVFEADERVKRLIQSCSVERCVQHLRGLAGSSAAFVLSALFKNTSKLFFVILPNKEEAAYFLNDLENINGTEGIHFYPESYRRAYQSRTTDNSNILLRTEALNQIAAGQARCIVTYPEALSEKVITREQIQSKTLRLQVGEAVDLDFITDVLIDYDFERADFVYEPGQFALRGGIVDVFSYSDDLPYRIEFSGDHVESIRSFNPDDQLSVKKYDQIQIIPNIEQKTTGEVRKSILEFIPDDTCLWIADIAKTEHILDEIFAQTENDYATIAPEVKQVPPAELFINALNFRNQLSGFGITEFGTAFYTKADNNYQFDFQPQPPTHKDFNILLQNLSENQKRAVTNYIFSDQPRQIERLHSIFADLKPRQQTAENEEVKALFEPQYYAITAGFTSMEFGIACFADHVIFDRYKRFKIKSQFSSEGTITMKELSNLNPGDFITHIDHGIGRFAGLERIETNGKVQEAVKIIYKDNDVIFVNIHSLHRIAKYSGKEGAIPTLHKLGGTAWQATKAKTKKRIKELAFDLIQLYAKRKAQKGFAYSPDNYMQHELEASFLYEDTPDQSKATADVKKDMEKAWPMDRLVCGDVGFGKTEVAIRAAFKAVCDGKQVAVLVPTTILALQHFKTFAARLKEFPVKVDYINRFKSTKQQKDTLARLAEGKVDILIGTHRIVGNDVKFKDLGLLIVDEEQKFGVSVKEKLKTMKVNVDTLTLTATPIPRTLQFSLMGARDLSIIRTPPPNRYPVVTELHSFKEDIIRDYIHYELQRNGQVYFVHNRVNDIKDVAGMVQRLCPDAKIRIAHGQMDGAELEEVMLQFIEGDFDVLVSTAIVEAGLDVPNANTIIINGAQNFGLSDLHQLRGRVGRSNKKAFCCLLSPPLHTLTEEARKRLRAIIEFSDLGSGFNISMRDLDIRGSGDILGAEQSGFINDIGYETYQKILNEAIRELKDNEFAALFKEEEEEAQKHGKNWADDCIIDTDMEILLPATYVDNITERLSLYKDLDNINDEQGIVNFETMLRDRFGPLPTPVVELLNTISLRNLAKSIGIEKLTLKNSIMICSFVNKDAYYQSPVFAAVLSNIQSLNDAEMKQKNDKLSITFRRVMNVETAINKLKKLAGIHDIVLNQ